MAHGEFNRKGVGELFAQLMSMSRKRQFAMLEEQGISGRIPFLEIEGLDRENIRVVFQPREGKETVGLAKVVHGDFDADGNWVPGRWLNGDEIQLRYDILPAIEEGYSGQGLDFGRPSPEFIKVQLYKY